MAIETLDDVKTLIEDAMVTMVLDFEPLATLASKFGINILNNSNVPACAFTDGTGIYFNARYILEQYKKGSYRVDNKVFDTKLSKDNIVFIIAHELMHLLMLTNDRGKQIGISRYVCNAKDMYKNRLWNEATDYEINSKLYNNVTVNALGNSISRQIGKMPEWVLYKEKYKDMLAEKIYEDLQNTQSFENSPEAQKEKLQKLVQDAIENGQTGESDTNDSEDGITLDIHMPIKDDNIKNSVIGKIAEFFGSRTNGLGLTAFDRTLDENFKKEPFNWKQALSKYIRGWMKDNYTWNRPSRAGIANNLILPSAGKTPKMHIAVAIDTSGSIAEKELQAMANHLFSILTQFKDFTVDVWCCGSKVYEETFVKYTAANKKDIYNFKFMSDGGNDMRKNFEFLKSHYKGNKPDVFICMTDGYDPIDGDNETTSPCPVIGLILDHDDFTPPSKMKFTVFPFKILDK